MSATTAATSATDTRAGDDRYSWSAEVFLEALADSLVIAEACKAAGVARSTAYRRRKADAEFAARWTEVEEQATDELEQIAYKRASEGSDRLIEFLLRARRPEVYRERVSIEDDREAAKRRQFETMDDDELDAELTGLEDNVVSLDDRRAG